VRVRGNDSNLLLEGHIQRATSGARANQTLSRDECTTRGPLDRPPFRNGKRLTCWADIWSALEIEGDARELRNKRNQMKRHNEKYGGPIRWVGRRPHVDEGELRAWLDGLAFAASEAEHQREGAQRLTEYHARIEIGFHEEKRPNAKGKAR